MKEEKDRGVRTRVVRPRWSEALFVCGKCLKRHPDGKAMRHALKGEVKRHAGSDGKRGVRMIKTACVGLCPRKAIIIASAVTLADGNVVLVHISADIPDAVARVLPRSRSPVIRPAASIPGEHSES